MPHVANLNVISPNGKQLVLPPNEAAGDPNLERSRKESISTCQRSVVVG